MLSFSDSIKVFVSTCPADMRKAIDGLSMLVIEELEKEPQSASVFVFFNKARNKVKILYWDRNGFALHYKRLSKGKFGVPGDEVSSHYEITQEQLNWLLAGLDFHLMSLYPELNFENYY